MLQAGIHCRICRRQFIHSFILIIYIAPLQYSASTMHGNGQRFKQIHDVIFSASRGHVSK